MSHRLFFLSIMLVLKTVLFSQTSSLQLILNGENLDTLDIKIIQNKLWINGMPADESGIKFQMNRTVGQMTNVPFSSLSGPNSRDKGYLGVQVIKEGDGLIIGRVDMKSSIKNNHLRKGYRIISVNGQPISQIAEWDKAIEDKMEGDFITLEFYTSPQPRPNDVLLSEKLYFDKLTNINAGFPRIPNTGVIDLGLTVLEQNECLKITKIKPNSNADHAGLKVGDCIQALNNEKIQDGVQMQKFFKTYRSNLVNVTYQRGKVTKVVEMMLR